MEIRIKGCDDCPASVMLDMKPGYGCQLKKTDDNGVYLVIPQTKRYRPITPKWCPLKQESILLTLTKKKSYGK
jgi:hypothetical protein